jgi:hypothetical protein
MWKQDDFFRTKIESYFSKYEQVTKKKAKGIIIWLSTGDKIPAIKLDALEESLVIWLHGNELKDCLVVLYKNIIGFRIADEEQGMPFIFS